MGGTKTKSRKNRRQSLTKIRHLNMLRRAAEQDQLEIVGREEAEGDDTGVSEAGAVDGDDAAVQVGGAVEEVESDAAGGAMEADFETDGIYDTDADGDTRRELVIAVRCMTDAGLTNFLKSAVGGKMKGQNLSTCLSRTVSLAQYVHEKVLTTSLLPYQGTNDIFVLAFRHDDARRGGHRNYL